MSWDSYTTALRAGLVRDLMWLLFVLGLLGAGAIVLSLWKFFGVPFWPMLIGLAASLPIQAWLVWLGFRVYRDVHRKITRLESGPGIRVSAHPRMMDVMGTLLKGPFSIRQAVVVTAWNASGASTGPVVPWVGYYGPEGEPWVDGDEIRRSWIDLSETQGSSAVVLPRTPPTEHPEVSLAATGVPFDVLIAETFIPQQGRQPGIPLGGGVSNGIPENVTLWARLRIAGDGMPVANSWWFTFRFKTEGTDAFLEIEASPAPEWAAAAVSQQ